MIFQWRATHYKLKDCCFAYHVVARSNIVPSGFLRLKQPLTLKCNPEGMQIDGQNS